MMSLLDLFKRWFGAPAPAATAPAPAPPAPSVPQPLPSPSPAAPQSNPLAGMPFDYLIGTDNPGQGKEGRFTIVSFGIHSPLKNGVSGAYVNLLDEAGETIFGPYLKPKGTAAQYNEGIPDPAGLGFERNLRVQIERKKRGGFKILGDIDNADTFRLGTVLKAYNIAHAEGFQFIVKNPGLGASSIDGDSDAELREDATALVAHPGAVGIIVEQGAGTPKEMDALRRKAGRPDMPVRFVSYGAGRQWATDVAQETKHYSDMGVTYSSSGEYGNSIDISRPVMKAAVVAPIVPVPVPSPIRPPPQVLISQAAINLIVAEEVTSEKHYTAALRHGEWPGGGSGVTIGIGYDVGAGVSDKSQLWADWSTHIADGMIKALEPAIGVTGSAAKSLLASIKSKIDVPWDAAMAVYSSTVLPRWYGICKQYLPNFELLSPDSRGALVSLTYNRGPSFNRDGDRYKEMRNIKAHMTAKAFEKIPHELRSMKRIWEGQGLPGLLKRRDREADLFLLGLGDVDDVPAPAVIVERDVKETQRRLIAAGLLDPPADGVVGPLTRWAMLQPTPVPLVLRDDVASALIRPMLKYGYFVARAAGCYNIIYAEGVSLVNGRLVANGNPPNRFNDLRTLVVIDAKGFPQLAGSWEGTTEPSKFWTHSRMNPAGAARVKFGQYKAWTYGDYNGVPALRQAGPIAVYRDDDENFRRDGDVLDTGNFGIHHHGGYDLKVDDLGRSSAGCLVGRTTSGHASFMSILRGDRRFQLSSTYKFMAAILDAPDVAPLVA